MAPSAKKKGAPASSSKPVRPPAKTHDGRPTRAEKAPINRAVSRDITKNALTVVQSLSVPIVEQVAKERTKPKGRQPDPEYSWTDELGEQMFALMATGATIRSLGDIPNGPNLYQIMKWLSNETHPLSLLHARAKDLLVPLFEDDARATAMLPNNFSIITKKQVLTKDGDLVDVEEERIVDNVDRSRLAFTALQWTLSHLKPKKHGRNAQGDVGRNEQLEGLFAALKAGPVE